MRVEALSVYAVPALLIFGAWLILMVKILIVDTRKEMKSDKIYTGAREQHTGTYGGGRCAGKPEAFIS